jgi:hypothetical protein
MAFIPLKAFAADCDMRRGEDDACMARGPIATTESAAASLAAEAGWFVLWTTTICPKCRAEFEATVFAGRK